MRDLESMLPRLPQRPLRQVLPEVTPARGEAKYQVGFFLGCAQSLMFADESMAAVRVLSRNGCTVTTPRDVKCCGMPAHGYGRLDLVRDQAKHNISESNYSRFQFLSFRRYEVQVVLAQIKKWVPHIHTIPIYILRFDQSTIRQ
jgi:glycolate oxidase iron-sulfur subunit